MRSVVFLQLVLVVLAVLSACYGFSVLLRSFAEWRFFRKYPASSAKRLGRWWSPFVGLAAMALSAVPAGVSYSWQQQYGQGEYGWPHAVGVGLLIFAGWMAAAWFIGERARGRRWCPRCRYDMEGTPGLRCPECGKLVRSERGLGRPRRPKWAGRFAIVLVLMGTYTLRVARPVMEYGPLMAVPTWVLMAGWSWLPEAWITDTAGVDIGGRLQDRLQYSEPITTERRFRFASKLLNGMYESEDARWNKRRGVLLNAAIGPQAFMYKEDVSSVSPRLAALGQRHTDLLDLLGVELVNAAASQDADPRIADRIHRSRSSNEFHSHSYLFVQYLVHAYADAELDLDKLGDSTVREFERVRFCHQFMPRTKEHGVAAGLTFEQIDLGITIEAALDSGFLVDYADTFFPDNTTTPDQFDYGLRSAHLMFALAYFDAEETAIARAKLLEWAGADSSNKRAFANLTLAHWARAERSAYEMPDPIRRRAINQAVASLSDRTALWDDEHYGTYTPRHPAQLALVMLDTSGDVSMPLIRQWLLDGEDPPSGYLQSPKADVRLIVAWAEHLSDLAFSEDVRVRRWLAETLPTRSGTPVDDRIDRVIDALLNDTDEDVRDNAEFAREERAQYAKSP